MKKLITLILIAFAISANAQVYKTVTMALDTGTNVAKLRAGVQTYNLTDSFLEKANLTGGNSFSGNQTISGNLYMPSNRWIGYDNTSPLAPIHVGNRNVLNSSYARILVSGVYDNSYPLSGHAFSDGSLLDGVTGLKAYAAYDGRVDIQGITNMDHYVSYQHGPTMAFTGTLKDNFGLFTTTGISSGTITNNYGVYLANPQVSGSAVIQNNFGLYLGDQTAGVNNYGIYSDGGANYFKSSTTIDGQINANNSGANMRIKADGTTAKDGGLYASTLGQIVLGNWDQNYGINIFPTGSGEYFGGDFNVLNGVSSAISIGAGTTSPDAKIHAIGGASMTGGWNRNALFEASYPLIAFKSTGSGQFGGISYDNGIYFWTGSATNDVTSSTAKAVILENGNVGVGVTAPSEKLEVAGNVKASGNVSMADPTSPEHGATKGYVDGKFTSGTYTPTVTANSNVSSSTAYKSHYLRVGNEVTVYGSVNISPTAGSNTTTQFSLTLPIASNLASGDLSGIGNVTDYSRGSAVVAFEDSANDKATISFNSTTTSGIGINYSFTYTVK